MEYFYSDFHYNLKNILGFERYQFGSIEEHDDFIMSTLEKTITKSDTLYFLGDIGFPTEDITLRLKKLPGYKIMVKGNHDKRGCDYYKDTYGFNEVYDHPLWLTKRIVISHIPVPVEDGVINIHGHLHGSYLNKKNYINANVHLVNYKPLSMKKVMNLLQSLDKPNYDFLCEWYHNYQTLIDEQLSREDLLHDTDHVVVGYTAFGVNNHQPLHRIEINKKQLLYRTVVLDGVQYTIIDISNDGMILTLVNMETMEETQKKLEEIKELEGYGRLNG